MHKHGYAGIYFVFYKGRGNVYRRPWKLPVIFGLSVMTSLVNYAPVQSEANGQNRGNNPLNFAPSFDVRDLYSAGVYGANAHTSSLLGWPTVSVGPVGPIDVPRFSDDCLNWYGADPAGGCNTCFSGINLFDIFLPGQGETHGRRTANHCAYGNRPPPQPRQTVGCSSGIDGR